MKIYVDLLLIINFIIDFILLISVSIILRRQINYTKLFISSFIGSLSILLLFLNITSLELFVIKVLISIIMILIAFGFNTIKYFLINLSMLYVNSIVLGGFLYFIDNLFSYKNNDLTFSYGGISINAISLVILSPMILYIYVKQIKNIKNNYNNYYKIIITINKINYECISFLDTGNKLKDPITNKNIILVNKHVFNNNKLPPPLLVPIVTVNNKSFIECVKGKIVINNKIINNILIGLVDNNINIDGADCILNNELLERGIL